MRDKRDHATGELPGLDLPQVAAPQQPEPAAPAAKRGRKPLPAQEQLSFLEETDASGLPVWRHDPGLDLTGLPIWSPA
ncbi:hypothetical protein [Massilia sp. TS11]|uniref:hypothetical protein n=1 Tax=Massilia sp. TS11 TaxID=2908003 RepID=UPI001EDBB59D|nr:hypothetical protein [Massilia sp. TS11]MCG2583349.1 hypothetical protein [Massilia sp. TS11]